MRTLREQLCLQSSAQDEPVGGTGAPCHPEKRLPLSGPGREKTADRPGTMTLLCPHDPGGRKGQVQLSPNGQMVEAQEVGTHGLAPKPGL